MSERDRGTVLVQCQYGLYLDSHWTPLSSATKSSLKSSICDDLPGLAKHPGYVMIQPSDAAGHRTFYVHNIHNWTRTAEMNQSPPHRSHEKNKPFTFPSPSKKKRKQKSGAMEGGGGVSNSNMVSRFNDSTTCPNEKKERKKEKSNQPHCGSHNRIRSHPPRPARFNSVYASQLRQHQPRLLPRIPQLRRNPDSNNFSLSIT